jgi:pyridoxal phosphate enzyme (YggS family)
MQREIIENIRQINARMDEACVSSDRSKDEITLIAVSKKKSYEVIEIAMNNGVYDFGENYAQELQNKSCLVNSDKIVWHFIGPIQSNKLKIIADCADWVHTLDREKIIKKLNSECKKLNKKINACIQINISSEISKSGCNPEDLFELAKLVESMENINLKGIMALPKLTNDKKERGFMMQAVKNLSIELQYIYPNANVISLGTTSDFEDAIIHGSNMLRIGESIFGKRL